MTIKKTDQNPVFGLAANTGQQLKATGVLQISSRELPFSDDPDDSVHFGEEAYTYKQITTEEPDELVHRMNTFKPGKSLTTDPDDEIHNRNLPEDFNEER